MKILVVERALAGWLCRAGPSARSFLELIERSGENDPAGYAISLYPTGSRVLHGLGVYEEFVERSSEFRITTCMMAAARC